ncbi:pentapeptide repeat-containing protein [Streptomyces sp. NRRL F-5123]|uniref:pentapeptide repeat-containing protein n=1 Tax=Streptomyces sp. NRRL F-5123 TaxID=1463856 RepID=UPI0006945B54|nr:pentapeptide repeat-containing protein [Streptomyces sp. NRRL F-5123]
MRGRWGRWWVLGLVGAAGVTGGVLLILGPLSWLVAGGSVRALHGKDQADAVNAVRQTVLAAFAGATVFVSLAYTARTYVLTRRGQVTERFRASVEQLASPHTEVRLGGIYSLEHVLAESEQDHDAVVGVLAAYVRNRTGAEPGPPAVLPAVRNAGRPMPEWGTQPPQDVQAAVDVLARRPRRPEVRRVDLRGAVLVGLSLRAFEFAAPPRLSPAFLTAADLRRADLRGVEFHRSILNGADLRRANLAGARLAGVPLSGADLREAILVDADLGDADLSRADLRDASGLTAEQLAGAHLDAETRLPPELAADPWVAARLAECAAWTPVRTSNGPPPTSRPL